MSGDRPHRTARAPSGSGSGSNPSRHRSADEIVRSILDDRPSISDVSPSGELLRAIGRSYGVPSRRHSPLNPGPASMPPERDPTRDLQRRFSREPRSRTSQHATSSSSGPSLPPLRGHHRRNRRMLETGNMLGELEQDIEELEDANSTLRALLDGSPMGELLSTSPMVGSVPPPSPPLGGVDPRAPSPPYSQIRDQLDESRRVKRRRLDSDRSVSDFKGFRYGQLGQVEPGELVMEIVSCDGGMFSEGTYYAAENILKPDNSVYCTKGNRCNIILQHQGATVFTLTELVIKAPGRNYSAPVREGMAFLSLERDDLLQRTAQYQIQYVPSLRSSRSSQEREARANPIISIRHNTDGTFVSRTRIRQRISNRMSSFHDDDEEYARAQIPSEFSVGPPQLRVTTECVVDNDEENAPRPPRRTPYRLGSLSFEDENDRMSNWGHDDEFTFEALNAEPSYSRGNSMSLSEAAEASQLATQEAVRAVGGELMVPCARFNIEKDTTTCIIRFDPPVSGRFLLLKMWNPHLAPPGHGNIDIQGVVAKGFAGPRFVPAVELR